MYQVRDKRIEAAPLPKLWEIGAKIEELEDLIVDILEADNLTESEKELRLQATFNEWLRAGEAFEAKAEQVALFIRQVEAVAQSRQAESRRLKSLAEQAENKAERLRAYLVAEMQRANKTKIDGVKAKFWLRRQPSRVVLNCAVGEVPENFVRVFREPRLNEIKAHLKQHPETDWAYLSQTTESRLQIR